MERFGVNTAAGTNYETAIKTEDFSDTLFEKWIRYIDASPRTVDSYKKDLRQFFAYLSRNGIKNPTRETIIDYRTYLLEEHKPTTVQNYITAVKLFFKWTQQEGLYPNVADRVKGAKIDKEHKRDYLTSSQTENLLKKIDRSSISGKRDYAMLTLMVTTGLRTISVSLANIGDIQSLGDTMVLYYQGKGHNEKASYVKLSDMTEEAIRNYLSKRGSAKGTDPLFASVAHRNNGKRMTTKSISRIAKEHMVETGLNSDRITAHSLRHTAATLNLLNGGSIEETQQLLDHSNINTTMIYSHALERDRNNSEQRISDAVFGKKSQ